MNPVYKIFLYSKYSPNCKKFNLLVQNNGLNFPQLGLQPLCVDNPQIRQRVQADENMRVASVPCLLMVYSNGTVEKYEGGYCFNWIENIIAQLKPPQPKLPPRPVPAPELPEDVEYKAPPEEPISQQPPTRSRPRMRKIQNVGEENTEETVTSIDDIPTDDEQEDSENKNMIRRVVQDMGDRHRNMRPRAQIRKDRGNYEDDEEMFSGAPPEPQAGVSSAIRNPQPTTANNPDSLMAKADAMRRTRAAINESVKPVGKKMTRGNITGSVGRR